MKDIIPNILVTLGNAEYFDLAIDALAEFVMSPGNTKYAATVCSLIPHITSRQEEFFRAIRADEQDKVMGFCRLMLAIGETFPHHITASFPVSPDIQQLVFMLLEATSYPGAYPVEQSISPMTLNFWFQLTENCLDSEDRPDQKALDPLFNTFASLLRILCGKSQFPEDYSAWPKGCCCFCSLPPPFLCEVFIPTFRYCRGSGRF